MSDCAKQRVSTAEEDLFRVVLCLACVFGCEM